MYLLLMCHKFLEPDRRFYIQNRLRCSSFRCSWILSFPSNHENRDATVSHITRLSLAITSCLLVKCIISSRVTNEVGVAHSVQ